MCNDVQHLNVKSNDIIPKTNSKSQPAAKATVTENCTSLFQ